MTDSPQPYRPMTVRRPRVHPLYWDRQPVTQRELIETTARRVTLPEPAPGRLSHSSAGAPTPLAPVPTPPEQVPAHLLQFLGALEVRPRHRSRTDLLANLIGTAAVVTVLCIVTWATVMGLLAWSTPR